METLKEVSAPESAKEQNANILRERMNAMNERTGARVGDFIKLQTENGDFYTRITNMHDDTVQTGGMGGSYYLGHGYTSYSGGLDIGVRKQDLQTTLETKNGSIWFFSQDHHRAHNGVDFSVPFRVFTVKDGADLKNVRDYQKEVEKIALSKLPTITRVNGNGQPYTTPLPKIMLCKEYNSVFMEHLEKSTGLKFAPAFQGKIAQPTTHEQLNAFFVVSNWKYTYYNNSTFENVIMIDRDEK